MLLCPLTLRDRPAGDPLIGVLVVFGARRVLTDLSPTFEILAHQGALAVERIALSQEVIRQRSEAYFRTLVQDTSDAILIVADDGLVRYATPSAASIFGEIGTAGVYLWELVADSQRDTIIKALARLRRSASSGPPSRTGRSSAATSAASRSRSAPATCGTTTPWPAWC